MRRQLLIPALITAALVLAACGDDDASDRATAPTEAAAATATPSTSPSTESTEATAAVETAETSVTTAASSGGGPPADPDSAAAAEAWTTAFDSTIGFADKAAYIADAEALRATIEAYTPAGEAVGGIALLPTDVVVSGDTAKITYDVTFADQVAYEDQEGTIKRIDGEWVVSRKEFCGFMASARNPCPS